MVECLTQDRGVAGLSLTGGTAECLGKTLYLLLSTGSTEEDPFQYDWKIVDRDLKD